MCVIEDSPRIETRRLLLRAPEAHDAPRIAELAADWDVVRMTGRMPYPYALSDAETFVAKVAAQDPARDNTFLLDHGPDGPIGMVGFFHDGDRYPEVGYWVGKPFWGRGFATEALEAALGWAKRRWRKRAVIAGHFSDNPASGQVLAKAGFLYTGEVRTKTSLARGGPVSVRMMMWLA
jgi:RimJ/RimL family protein N-acetyltransferase